jgi:hypothetical protein
MNKGMKEQLAELEAKSRIINEFSGNIAKQKLQVSKEISALEAKIADEAKPKLRHGDYGRVNDQDWAHLHGQTYWTIKDVDPEVRISELTDSYFIENSKEILNFADNPITSLQEDVTEFEIERNDGKRIKVCLIGNCIQFYDPTDRHLTNMYLDKNPDAITKLCQMQATLKRNESKEIEQ